MKEGTLKIPKKRKAREQSNSAPRKKPVQREREIQKSIIAYLYLKGVKVGHIKTKGSMGSHGQFLKHKNVWKGIPDLLAFYKNSMWWIEIKAPKGYLSKEQKIFQELCLNANINHLVAREIRDLDPIFKGDKI